MTWLIGVDEVGRGPLAGPIMFCAFIYKINLDTPQTADTASQLISVQDALLEYYPNRKLLDSKKLSRKSRVMVADALANMNYHHSQRNPESIDNKGLAQCIRECLAELLSHIDQHIMAEPSHTVPRLIHIYLDGGLRLDSVQLEQLRRKHKVNINTETIIKGDEKVPVIASASILAKVARDQLMANYNEEILKATGVDYNWTKNAGYGTAKHREIMRLHGLTPYHRRSFVHV